MTISRESIERIAQAHDRRLPPPVSDDDRASNGQPPEREGAAPWSPLGSLPGAERPGFPVDALPCPVQGWVEATAEATQTPIDLAAGLALAVASTAALGAAVEVGSGWKEEVALYLACVLPSAERKSEVKGRAVEPLQKIERERINRAREGILQARAQRDALESQRKRLVTEAGKNKATYQEIAAVDAEIAQVGSTVEPRVFADDATPEALAGLLADHGRLGVISAESAFLDNLAGRYAEKGRPNLHLVCQAYSGEPVRVDRRGRDPEHIDRPVLAIGLCVQPHVLAAMAEHEVMREQGLVGRFAFLLPTTALGSRITDPPPVPEHVARQYADAIRGVAESCDTTDKTPLAGGSVGSVASFQGPKITLSPGAREAFRQMRDAHEPRLHPHSGDLARLGAWANRLPGRVARIAGLLHLLDGNPTAEPISKGTMDAAVRIGEYLIDHARAALDPERDDRPAQAVAWIKRNSSATFTLRDLHRGAFGAHGPVEPIEGVCDRLIELGHLRGCQSPPPSPKGGRPPSPSYQVNPAVIAPPRDRADAG